LLNCPENGWRDDEASTEVCTLGMQPAHLEPVVQPALREVEQLRGGGERYGLGNAFHFASSIPFLEKRKAAR